MRLPSFLTEEQFLTAFDNVIVKLVSKFTFNMFDRDDIKQEAFIIASEGVFSYNPSFGVPLENFLYTHLRNRLINFKRDNYLRRETSCQECKTLQKLCSRCSQREALNSVKKSILEPANIDSMAHPTYEIDLSDGIDSNALLAEVFLQMPASMVEDFYKVRDGVRINTNKKRRIIELIKRIAEELGYAS